MYLHYSSTHMLHTTWFLKVLLQQSVGLFILQKNQVVLILKKTSPKGFSASKCDEGNWILSKSQKSFENFFGNFLDFLGNFLGILQEDFFEGIYLEEFFGRNFLGGFFGRNSLFTLLKSAKLLRIDLFVKILSKSKKEGRILDPQKCDCKYIHRT